MKTKDNPGTEITGVVEETKVTIKLPNLHALKQLAQDILNAVDKYEKSVKKEPEDGK